MGTSKQLITALEKSDWLDRLLILSALVFFFLVVLFILKQRIIDRALRIALWWTRFLPTGEIDFDKMEKGELVIGAASVVVSSATASASSTSTGLSHPGSDAFEPSSSITVGETLSPSLSAVISSAADSPRTTDPVDSSLGVHDEL
jgi:protein transport protein SEC20